MAQETKKRKARAGLYQRGAEDARKAFMAQLSCAIDCWPRRPSLSTLKLIGSESEEIHQQLLRFAEQLKRDHPRRVRRQRPNAEAESQGLLIS